MLRPKPKRRSLLKRWRLKSRRGDGSGVRPLKKKIFYTKLYFVKKTDREEMKVEGDRAKKTRKCHKTSVIKTRPKTGWYKTYLKKEMMAIEKIENTEAASKSPPKKGNPDVKPKSKGPPFAPQKKMKKNTPKKSSGGLN